MRTGFGAFSAFGEIKYAIYQQTKTPILGLKTSYFSGDSDPDDGELSTFYDPVFGTPYFGYARNYNRSVDFKKLNWEDWTRKRPTS